MDFVLYQRHGMPGTFEEELESLRKWAIEITRHGKRDLFRRNKDIDYYNIPCAFDIETTSYEDKNGKHGLRYAYVFGLYGKVFVGRTWEQAMQRFDRVIDILKITPARQLIIYVHNLAYEFQFIRKRRRWLKVFAIDDRKVCYATNEDGLTFKCSYILSGYGLAKVGEHLMKYRVQKMVGDLDYNLRRGSTTPLTEKEWGYIYNDGLVVRAYIQEEIEKNGNKIYAIPATKTGYVRRYRKKECLYEGSSNHHNCGKGFVWYRKIVGRQTLEPREYKRLRQAFMGGFTHGNRRNVGKVQSHVQSRDFTSSYPAVRIREKYPCDKGERVEIRSEADLDRYGYGFVFAVCFEGLKTRPGVTDHYLSISKSLAKNAVVDNGRIISADSVRIARTNIDFQITKWCYTWDKVVFGEAYRYKLAYLPTPFVQGVVKLYKDKTTLKGVAGKEAEYRCSKENLNSCYGRCVTDICRNESVYADDTWSKNRANLEEAIKKYNEQKDRFLSYAWGIFVTAYARRNLWTGIRELGDDYIYSDTDSLKYRHPEKHQKYFDDYNAEVKKKLERACAFHGFTMEDVAPKTIQGKTKRIGVWDDDGLYTRFKTLGAKRYRVEHEDGSMQITIAGVNKKAGRDYLKWKFKDNDAIFENFQPDLIFPATYENDDHLLEGSGKDVHTYIDTEDSGEFIDYTGRIQKWTELSSIHLAPTSYSLSLADEFFDILLSLGGIKQR